MKISLTIKNKNYYAVIAYHEKGKRKVKWEALHLTTDARKKDINARLKEIEAKYKALVETLDETLFTNYLTEWVKRRKGLVENSTWEGIEIYAHRHIIPYFESMRLHVDEITPSHIEEYYKFKLKDGRCDRKRGGLSVESVIKHKSALMTALDDAVIDGLIRKNPARYAKFPAKRTSERREVFLTAEEAERMLKLFEGTPFYAFVYICLFYGTRKSEALGLKWNAIDFANDTLTLQNVVVKNRGIEEKSRMKTASSYHTYTMIPEVKDVLIKQRFWQNENKVKYGEKYQDSDWVFTWEDGRPFRPDSILKSIQRVLQRNHFTPMVTVQDLRHSTASMLYARGWEEKDIQMWLRHADIKTTLNVYTHIKQDFTNDIPDYLQSGFSPTPQLKGVLTGIETKKE